MFYIVWFVCIVCTLVMVYAVNHMPRHSFWQVIVFDTALLIALVTGVICLFLAYKGLRPARVIQ